MFSDEGRCWRLRGGKGRSLTQLLRKKTFSTQQKAADSARRNLGTSAWTWALYTRNLVYFEQEIPSMCSLRVIILFSFNPLCFPSLGSRNSSYDSSCINKYAKKEKKQSLSSSSLFLCCLPACLLQNIILLMLFSCS